MAFKAASGSMADNLYETLGVPRRASDEEIRRAFRKLAKENHPDLNPGIPAAVERFKKITAANEILGDPQKRRQYDAGEIDAKGEPQRRFVRTSTGDEEFAALRGGLLGGAIIAGAAFGSRPLYVNSESGRPNASAFPVRQNNSAPDSVK